ncbi:MAG: NAD-dependent epimerase/dehydratase family protein, partial [Anaerolineales bacterium]|nr:NAD-dependent epimerase/dehydratase family protein [Anaerolineales bacterium]
MKILITGGAGFIGSHTVQAALAAGHSVRVLDNLSTGLRTNLPVDVDLIEGDVNDTAAVAKALAGCDAVLHLAALVSVPYSMRDPVATFHINTEGAVTLLEAAHQCGIRRFVLASTCAVYGDLPGRKTEGSPVQPLSPYAASKLAAEAWVQVYARAYAMETVVLRYFNVYGARQRADSPYSGVIARWCSAAAAGRPCTVYGDGQQTRDFVAVQDVAAANLLALTAELPWGEIFNIATGESITLNTLLQALETVFNGAIPRI